MPSCLAPTICAVLASIASCAQLVDYSSSIIRREVLDQRQRQETDKCLSSGFQLKSIGLAKCLEVPETGATLGFALCNDTEPRQRFQKGDGSNGHNVYGLGDLKTCAEDASDEKTVCAHLGGAGSSNREMQAVSSCADAELSNITFKFLSNVCFEISVESEKDSCFEGKAPLDPFASDYLSFEGSCSTEETQWTTDAKDVDKCSEAVVAGTNGIQGGAAAEGGTGGEAPVQSGTPLTNDGDEARAAAKLKIAAEEAQNETGKAFDVANSDGVTASPTADDGNDDTKSYGMILKYMGCGEQHCMDKEANRDGLCMQMDGIKFEMATCDHSNPNQIFTAHGITEIFKGRLPTYVQGITMGTGDSEKNLCLAGSDNNKVMAGAADCQHQNYMAVDLVHAEGHCFKVQWPKQDGDDTGAYSVNEDKCLKPDPTDDQEMQAVACPTDDEADAQVKASIRWLVIPEDKDYDDCLHSYHGSDPHEAT